MNCIPFLQHRSYRMAAQDESGDVLRASGGNPGGRSDNHPPDFNHPEKPRSPRTASLAAVRE
jgi:hypothetical protein